MIDVSPRSSAPSATSLDTARLRWSCSTAFMPGSQTGHREKPQGRRGDLVAHESRTLRGCFVATAPRNDLSLNPARSEIPTAFGVARRSRFADAEELEPQLDAPAFLERFA